MTTTATTEGNRYYYFVYYPSNISIAVTYNPKKKEKSK